MYLGNLIEWYGRTESRPPATAPSHAKESVARNNQAPLFKDCQANPEAAHNSQVVTRESRVVSKYYVEACAHRLGTERLSYGTLYDTPA